MSSVNVFGGPSLTSTFTFPVRLFYGRTMLMLMTLMTGRHLDAMPKGVPLPSHRHATPSGPWPWMDVDAEESHLPPQATPCPHPNCGFCLQWSLYPQSHFPNWTPRPGSKLQNSTFHHQLSTQLQDVSCRYSVRTRLIPQEERPPTEFHLTNDRHIELWVWL
jgi:hypothetical protein